MTTAVVALDRPRLAGVHLVGFESNDPPIMFTCQQIPIEWSFSKKARKRTIASNLAKSIMSASQ